MTQHRFLSAVIDSHERQLLKYFRARLPDPSEAWDLVQEVYLRLFKLERPDLIRDPRAYVYRVAANIAREHWLKRAARPIQVEFDDAAAEGHSSVEDGYETFEQLQQLALMLGELPPKVGAAVIWARRDGHTYQEIAERLAVSTSQVKKYLQRALTHCRKRAANDGPG